MLRLGLQVLHLYHCEPKTPQYKDFSPIRATTLYLKDWAGCLIVLSLTLFFGFLAAGLGILYVNKMDLAKMVAGGQLG